MEKKSKLGWQMDIDVELFEHYRSGVDENADDEDNMNGMNDEDESESNDDNHDGNDDGN